MYWREYAFLILLGSMVATAPAYADSATALPWRIGDECVVRDSIAPFLAFYTQDLQGHAVQISPGTKLKILDKQPESIRIKSEVHATSLYAKASVLLVQCQVNRTAWQNVWVHDAEFEDTSKTPKTSDTVPQALVPANISGSPIEPQTVAASTTPSSYTRWTSTGWTLTAAGLGGGIILGSMALSAQDGAMVGTPGSQRAARNAKLYAVLANTGYGVAAVGLVAVIVALSLEDAEQDAFTLAPTPDGRGIGVVGTW